MQAQINLYNQLCLILNINSTHSAYSENQKLYKAASVLQKDYLVSSSIEADNVIKHRIVHNKYDLMISIYNRKIKEHQVLVMLIQLFEVAMRTQAAIVLSNKYSSLNQDDWYFLPPSNAKHRKLQKKISDRALMLHQTIIPTTTSIDMFNMLMMGDIQSIYEANWSDLKNLFQNTTYKHNTITPLHTKAMFDARFERIKQYRNKLFHGNPGSSGWQQIIYDIEEIMVQLHYNLKDAINNIDPHHKIIHLQHSY